MRKPLENTVFEESNLSFSFDNQWIVHKYDDHRFYQQLAGRSVSGIDFIGIYQEKTLVLMEVKNYVDRYFKDDKNPSEDFLSNQEIYFKKISKKYVDSLRVIEAVQRAYRRKWWFHLAQKTLFKVIKKERFLHWEFVFWTKAWELMKAGELRLILWIEIEKGEGQIFEINEEELPVLVEIMSQKNQSFKRSLNVEFL
jgi:hypothetical protein